MRTSLALCLFALLCGCTPSGDRRPRSDYTKYSGDFAPFLSREITRFGGKASGPNARLDAEWWSKSDTDGFQILMPTNYRAQVQSCLRDMFGEPIVSGGYPHLLYRSTNVGVTILAQTQLDPMHLIITRAGVIHDERLPIGSDWKH